MANDTTDEEAEINNRTHTGDTLTNSQNWLCGAPQSNFVKADFAVLKDCVAVPED